MERYLFVPHLYIYNYEKKHKYVILIFSINIIDQL